ncbi:tumor necrosis factor receptor superfamily, member a isoform X1 [Scleropages formosus]|uniref:Tumor necrosis factor receptor superfamily, member a n=1 Tax=Scleropages formosus TaxID=113540 RepID=A0A8C9S6Z1_SCLFO|nr:tumor necrosis factor receptor superfamily member 10A-like isoform X1 [Scleropages formosus]
MATARFRVVFFISVLGLVTASDSPWSPDEDRNKTSRQRSCTENQEYLHDNMCCKNCEAGTHVKTPCVRDSEMGTCEPCEPSTFTEHSSGMDRCLQCKQCRKDEQMVAACTRTRDTQCQCKPGTFCVPEQACEVCKKCTRCKADEETVIECTSTSNTVCQKRDSSLPAQPTPTTEPPGSGKGPSLLLLLLLLFIPLAIFGGILFWRRKKQSRQNPVTRSHECDMVKIQMTSTSEQTTEEKQNNHNARREEPSQEETPLLVETRPLAKPVAAEDEDKGLGDSLPNTTSSSQTSLSALQTVPSSSSTPRNSPEPQRQLDSKGEFQRRRLIPLKGEESLKKSFDLFEQFLDVKIHNRFFRSIGLSDNLIKNSLNTHPEDRVYDLLKAWMQREGLSADINDLIDVLFNLDQKFSAEHIICKAVENKYYKYDEDCC